MTKEDVYKKLSGEAPKGFRINELFDFSYPVRKISLDVLVDKEPDGTLVKVYACLLNAITLGLGTQEELFEFLGVGQNDEFIVRELFTLREKGYIDLVSDEWVVTEFGKEFIEHNEIMRVEEEEEFEFLVDGISGDIISSKEYHSERKSLHKKLDDRLPSKIRNIELLEGKFDGIAELYKSETQGKSYLISYSGEKTKRDYLEWCHYWLIEYIPDQYSDHLPYIEIRKKGKNPTLNRDLTDKFNSEYREFIYNLSETDRADVEHVPEAIEIGPQDIPPDFTTLTIWETKGKFIEALRTVQNRILIESPWIKRAVDEYIGYFKDILSKEKELIILYGIDERDDHYKPVLDKLEKLRSQYRDTFQLIHLPTHFANTNVRLTGTHRKLVIKDNDYCIQGSFNFLSFGKNEKQRVANEESVVIAKDVEKKWTQIAEEYALEF